MDGTGPRRTGPGPVPFVRLSATTSVEGKRLHQLSGN